MTLGCIYYHSVDVPNMEWRFYPGHTFIIGKYLYDANLRYFSKIFFGAHPEKTVLQRCLRKIFLIL